MRKAGKEEGSQPSNLKVGELDGQIPGPVADVRHRLGRKRARRSQHLKLRATPLADTPRLLVFFAATAAVDVVVGPEDKGAGAARLEPRGGDGQAGRDGGGTVSRVGLEEPTGRFTLTQTHRGRSR